MAANPTVTDPNARRLAELAALVDAVKDRVRAQYPESTATGSTGVISVGLPDLAPLARARDAASAKMAAIGTVNPRAGGLVNNSIQSVKRAVARALNWFVRDQVIFNRQMITIVEISIETLAEINRTIHNLAIQTNTQLQEVRAENEPLRVEARALRTKTSELQDLGSHWQRWREEWQLKLHENEVAFLKSAADLNTAFHQKIAFVENAAHHRTAHSDSTLQQRVTDLQASFERRADALHLDYQNRLADHQQRSEQQASLLGAAYAKTASELDISYQRTARELEAACQQTASRIDGNFATAVTQSEKNFEHRVTNIETAYADQIRQFDARCTQIEHDTAASLRDQHDAFEQLANTNAAALDRRLVKQALDFQQSLDTSITDLQKKFYADLDRIRTEYEQVIHAELRVVRQRLATGIPPALAQPVAAPSSLPFDYARFADRFRGPEQYVTEAQRFYVPYFAGRRHVLDIGCGRGEFLKLMQEAGVPARGIEASHESVEYCRSLGLAAANADLFTYLSEQAETALDGIFCSQVVEHLPADRLPEFVRLCATRLATGGVLAIETPNPECLAIFATHFYLDPTHTRPIPPPLLAFYMEEFGLGRIEVHRRAPAVETNPEVGALPAAFRDKFFDGLDYAIIAYKL